MKNHTDEIIETLKNHLYNDDFGSTANKEYFLKAIAELSKINTEVKFYRDFIHDNGLEFEAMSRYSNWLSKQ